MNKEQKHYRRMFRPSSAARWMFCPGSEQFIKRLEEQGHLPPDKPTKHTDAGSFRHEIMQMMMEQILVMGKVGLFSKKNKTKVDMDQTRTWAEELAKNKYPDQDVDEALEDCKGALMAAIGFFQKNKKLEYMRTEWALEMDTAISGTIDVAAVWHNPKRAMDHMGALVLDWKFGFEPVSVKDNKQLMTYAVLSKTAWESIHQTYIDPVTLVIVQKNHGGDWEVKEHEMNHEEISLHVEHMIESVDKAMNHPWRDNLKPGIRQCRWCPAKAFCPAIQNSSTEVMEFRPKSLKEASPEQLAKMYELTEVAATVKSNIERHVIESGGIDGFVVETGRQGPRKWINPTLMKKEFEDEPDMWDKKLTTPTQLKKKNEKLYSRLEPMIERSPGTPKVSLAGHSIKDDMQRLIDLEDNNKPSTKEK